MKEDRRRIFKEYKGEKDEPVERMMVKYDRYSEANRILDFFRKNYGGVKRKKILDFGCGVGDYGLLFAREKAIVDFYDYKPYVDFVQYRARLENLPCKYICIGEPIHYVNYDLIVFGEVLDHLDDPLEVLKKCIKFKVEFIFTTSYPYIQDSAHYAKSGHTLNAWRQQTEFRELLETNYVKIAIYGDSQFIWTLSVENTK